jgi:hypothetical protein
VALAAIAGGIFLAAALPRSAALPVGRIIARLAAAGAVMALIAAPELLSLVRYSNLYAFLHYSGYATPGDWFRSTLQAAWWPTATFALVAVIWSLFAWTPMPRSSGSGSRHDLPLTRTVAWTLALYAGLTLVAVALPGAVSQLEATRLMPFQRLLVIWLGAAGFWLAIPWLAGKVRMHTTRSMFLPAAAAALIAVVWLRPDGAPMPLPGPPDPPDRGLYRIVMSDDSSMIALRDAVETASAAAEPGTAILVMGSNLSWHQQLWAPLWSDRPFLYDNWLWFWRPDHAGPPGYAFEGGHAYPQSVEALAETYLRRHGIGAVVASTAFTLEADARPYLAPTGRQGDTFSVWLVEDPVPLVTTGGLPAETGYRNGAIAATASAGGDVLIRHAWFPRWTATVDGRPASVRRTTDGFMALDPVAAGAGIELRYATDPLDWMARTLTVLGLAVILVLPAVSRPARAATVQ